MKSYSKVSFIMELSKIDWSSVLSSANVNYCVAEFSRLFKEAIDKVAPYKEIRVRNKQSPWMNAHILSGIRKRDDLFLRYRKNRKNVQLYKEFCVMRNAVQRDIKLAKETFFKRGVEM